MHGPPQPKVHAREARVHVNGVRVRAKRAREKKCGFRPGLLLFL